jgi:hypothetical protein
VIGGTISPVGILLSLPAVGRRMSCAWNCRRSCLNPRLENIKKTNIECYFSMGMLLRLAVKLFSSVQNRRLWFSAKHRDSDKESKDLLAVKGAAPATAQATVPPAPPPSVPESTTNLPPLRKGWKLKWTKEMDEEYVRILVKHDKGKMVEPGVGRLKRGLPVRMPYRRYSRIPTLLMSIK